MNTFLTNALLALLLVQSQPLRLMYAPPPVPPPNSPFAAVVALNLTLNSIGSVQNVSTIGGSAPFLDTSIEAVKQWKFALASGAENQSEVNVTFLYRPRQIYSSVNEIYVPQPPPLPNQASFPKIISDPSYPIQSVAEGFVLLEVRVSPTGLINEIRTIRGVPSLTDIARQTVATWRFSPGMIDGKPAEGITVVAISFLRPVS